MPMLTRGEPAARCAGAVDWASVEVVLLSLLGLWLMGPFRPPARACMRVPAGKDPIFGASVNDTGVLISYRKPLPPPQDERTTISGSSCARRLSGINVDAILSDGQWAS